MTNKIKPKTLINDYLIDTLPENTFSNSWNWDNWEQKQTILDLTKKLNELVDIINKLRG
jgi:hypothetical protein